MNYCELVRSDGVLDLRDYENSDGDAEELIIRGNEQIRVAYVPPLEAYTCVSVCIENLPNLVELHVAGSEVIWLRCLDLPSLQRISVSSSIKYLAISGLGAIEHLDLSNQKELNVLEIVDAAALNNVRLTGCIQLENIKLEGVPSAVETNVASQISAVQEGSYAGNTSGRLPIRKIRDSLNRINKASRSLVELGFIDIEMWGEEPIEFDFRLLNPLEDVYTGGSGERYSYEYIAGYRANNSFNVTNSRGEHTPEDCLRHALSELYEIALIPEGDNVTQDEFLDYVEQLAASQS